MYIGSGVIEIFNSGLNVRGLFFFLILNNTKSFHDFHRICENITLYYFLVLHVYLKTSLYGLVWTESSSAAVHLELKSKIWLQNKFIALNCVFNCCLNISSHPNFFGLEIQNFFVAKFYLHNPCNYTVQHHNSVNFNVSNDWRRLANVCTASC